VTAVPATARRRSGEGAQFLVNGRGGEAVGQGGQGVGADPQDRLKRVASGEAVTEELGHGLIAGLSRRVDDPEGERSDRVNLLLSA